MDLSGYLLEPDLDDSDPGSDSFFHDDFHDPDLDPLDELEELVRLDELDRLADQFHANHHAAFVHLGDDAAGQEHGGHFEEDDESSQEFESGESEETADRSSAASSSSQRSGFTSSDADSDSPESRQSRSTAGPASPSEASTASEDSLFVTQQQLVEEERAFQRRDYIDRHEQQVLTLSTLRQSLARLDTLHQSLARFDRHEREIRRAGLDRRDRDVERTDLRAPLTNFPALRSRNHPMDSPEDDELFEMEVGHFRRGRGSAGARPEPIQVPAAAPVIDLTNEPDSPEEITASSFPRNRAQAAQANGPASQRHRANPRRQHSFGRTPSLSRSDGSILGAAPVIDLTMEDDDDWPHFVNGRPAPLPSMHRRRPGDAQRPIDLAADPEVDNPGDEGPINRVLRRFNRNPIPHLPVASRALVEHVFGDRAGLFFPSLPDIFGGASVNNGGNNVANPLANNVPNFNYRANGYNNQGGLKPPFIPPPPPRPGFGRDTAEDLAFVCPSCEEELKYDPDAEEAKVRPAKRPRNKKDREEHHFWAVKECGHVYCKKCFDDRRPAKKHSGPPKTKFRTPDPKTILCAIEDCNSEVGPKGNWVGLFL